MPENVPIPFLDYFGLARFDWSQSSKSQWFLRASNDSYTTHNNLVQQGTLPSTGLLTHNNYFSLVIGNQFTFTPTLLGNLVLNASGLHLTQSRNTDLGFALAFPFSSTALTVSGFETYGDNQFATPITYFPSLRNQQKYQIRYDMTNARGAHTIKFGVNFIHEPVLGGAFPNNTETLYQLPQNPTYYLSNPSQFTTDLMNNVSTSNLGGGFSQNVQRSRGLCAGRMACLPAYDLQLRTPLFDDLWPADRRRTQPGFESGVHHACRARHSPGFSARRATTTSSLLRGSASHGLPETAAAP